MDEKEYNKFVCYFQTKSNYIIKNYNKSYVCIVVDKDNKVVFNNKIPQENTWNRYICTLINYNTIKEKSYMMLGRLHDFFQEVVNEKTKTINTYSLVYNGYTIIQYFTMLKCTKIDFLIKQCIINEKIYEINKEDGFVNINNTVIPVTSKKISEIMNGGNTENILCSKMKKDVGKINCYLRN